MVLHLRRRRLAARAASAATFVLVVASRLPCAAATGTGSSLHSRDTVQTASDLWTKCRQPVPCADNKNITAKYDVVRCYPRGPQRDSS